MDDDLPTPDDPAPGAAEALISSDPLIVQARNLLDAGRIHEARQLLDAAPVGIKRLADELQEIIARIELAYQTSAGQLLEKLRRLIPDASADDLRRWTDAGEVQFRTFDSRLRYFNREPANLFRFCNEAKARRVTPPPQRQANLHARLRQIVAAAERGNDTLLLPVDHRVEYQVMISDNAPGLERGALLRAWLPFPQELEQQCDVRLVDASPASYQLSPPSSPQRTIYFETTVSDAPPEFSVSFSYRSFARYPRFSDGPARPLPAGFPPGWLAERPPHIRFTPHVFAAARKAVANATNPLIKARRIYDYVVSNMTYAAEEEYGTISGLSDKAMLTRRGDCGVMAMFFITLCRAEGIPARWQSGFQTLPDEHDMHDWAEFYIAPFGWLPADPSYGCRGSDSAADSEICDFYFGHLDPYRLVVNRDFGRKLSPRKSLLRSEPLDFQRGEIELAGANLYFPHWSWEMRVRTDFSER